MSEEKKEKRSKEDILEIIIAIFLGVTALATAWAAWIGELHGGNQAGSYTNSTNLSAEGNAMWNEASQLLMQDMMTWNSINDMLIDKVYAEEAGDAEAVEKLDWKIDQMMTNNCTEEFVDAIYWALDQEEESSPFDMEGFVDSYFADALVVLEESEAELKKGEEANTHGDAFGLVTVIYSVVLFMLGIVGTFRALPNRFIVTGVAVAGFLLGTIYMFTIPMPEGFNILSFFGMG